MDAHIPAVLADAAERWLPWLIEGALKGTLVLGCAALITAAMRRASAAARHLVWSAALFGTIALPLATALAPTWLVEVPHIAVVRAFLRAAAPPAPASELATSAGPSDAAVSSREAAGEDRAGPQVAPSAPGTIASSAAAPMGRQAPFPAAVPDETVAASALPAPLSPWAWLALAWGAGSALVLARFVAGTIGVARLARTAQAADDPQWVLLLQRLSRELGIRRPVTLLIGRRGTVPVTWGVVYPVVLLPADGASWTAERRRLVLLHELAHVQRLDAFTHVVSQVALALFWFNPLVIAAVRRVRSERERACDDLVLASGVRPSTYADDLLEIVRTLQTPAPAAAALAMARTTEFEGRLLAILDPAVRRARASRGRIFAAAALVLATLVPLAAARPTLAAPIPLAAAVAGDYEAGDYAIDDGHTPAPAGPVQAASSHAAAAASAAAVSPPAVSGPANAEAALAARQAVPAERRLPPCGPRSGRHISIHSDDERTTTSIADAERCLQIVSRGRVEFTDDDGDVKRLSPGGYLYVEETRGGTTRRMDVTERGGRLERVYTIDGQERPAAEGAAWFRSVLPAVIRESAVGAGARATRIRRQRGVQGVLDEVALIHSDNAKRVYLEQLLADGPLTSDELRRTADVARRTVSSDGDKASVLRAVAKRGGTDPAVNAAVVNGASTISSDGDRRRVLEAAAADPATSIEVLTLVAGSAEGISSDGDRATVLQHIAPRVGASDALRRAFFRAARGISSDGDRRRVLLAALAGGRPPGSPDEPTVIGVLESAREISSDYERSVVLATVAGASGIASPAVRDAYFGVLDGISSDTDRARLLTGLAGRGVRGDVLLAVLRSTARLSSDTDKANVLLAIASGTPALKDASTRPAFFAAVRTLSSSSDYRRVMESVVQ